MEQTLSERMMRWHIANRWAEYRRCKNAPGCRRIVRRELRQAIAQLRQFMRDRGANTYRAPDWSYCLEFAA